MRAVKIAHDHDSELEDINIALSAHGATVQCRPRSPSMLLYRLAGDEPGSIYSSSQIFKADRE
jgi:hypothetical protein